MITKISGILDDVTDTAVTIENSGVFYRIEMPPVSLDRIRETHLAGEEIVIHTQYYIEGGVGVGNLFPRLVGFLEEKERSFFEVYTTVKGLGERKALQSLTIPLERVADAIERGDVYILKNLPGIGGRTAERIIAELRGKVTRFTAVSEKEPVMYQRIKPGSFEEQAVDILMNQLGYRRAEAEIMIRKVMTADPDVSSVEELIQKIYQRNTVTGST